MILENNANLPHIRSIFWTANFKSNSESKQAAVHHITHSTWQGEWKVEKLDSKGYRIFDQRGAISPNKSLCITHSKSMSCLVTAQDGDVGVDIEPLGRQVHWKKFKRMLTSQEYAVLERSEQDTPELTNDIFLTIWTLKEAVVKALNTGIANNFPMIQIEVKYVEGVYKVSNITTKTLDSRSVYWHSCDSNQHKLAIVIFCR